MAHFQNRSDSVNLLVCLLIPQASYFSEDCCWPSAFTDPTAADLTDAIKLDMDDQYSVVLANWESLALDDLDKNIYKIREHEVWDAVLVLEPIVTKLDEFLASKRSIRYIAELVQGTLTFLGD